MVLGGREVIGGVCIDDVPRSPCESFLVEAVLEDVTPAHYVTYSKKSANSVHLLFLTLVALLRAEQTQLHVLSALLTTHPAHHFAVHTQPAVLFVSLLDLQHFLVALEGPVKLLHLLLGNNAIVFAADQQNGHGLGYFAEVVHVILAEERQGESFLDFSLEEVENKGDEWLRKTGFLGDHSPHDFLQGSEWTVQH